MGPELKLFHCPELSEYETRRHRRKRIAIASGLLLIVGIVAGLWFSPRLLMVESQVQNADSIVVLGGRTQVRSELVRGQFVQTEIIFQNSRGWNRGLSGQRRDH